MNHFLTPLLINSKIRIGFLFLLLIISLNINAQQTDKVDFMVANVKVQPHILDKKITGNVSYSFKILKKTDSIFLDAVNMNLLKVTAEKSISVSSSNNKIWFVSNFIPDKTYTVSFEYEMTPKQTLYFTTNQIWTQGQGKYTSHWLPSLDDMNDKIEFDLSILVPKNNTVIANGKLLSVKEQNGFVNWTYNMENPMSSYLVAFAIGDFKKKMIHSNSGIPIELYYQPKDSLSFEPTYRYTKLIFDFFEEEIGVLYPWQNYKQVPLSDFLYAGMENTSATFFSEAFVVDTIGFKDRNYVHVNAHELAHQWFGNLVTETESKHHWLHEGFATYYAQLADRQIFGDDYFYWKLFQSAEQLTLLSNEGKGESLINPNASSLTFYEKGAWALHILNDIIGEENFKLAVKNYLEKHQFKNANTEDFMAEVEKVFHEDLSDFKNDWLNQSAFKAEQSYNYMIKSNFLNEFFKISALRKNPFSNRKNQLNTALTFPNDFIGQEAVYQLQGEDLIETMSLYKKAFASNNLYVRQAIALSLSAVPLDLKTEFESLLLDESYVTQEAALGNLWVSFPEEKKKYLDAMDGVQGFQDKNIRQFWLFLALITEDYNPTLQLSYLSELKNYTDSKFGHGIREIAFEYISYLGMWDTKTMMNLIDASQHHYWRFRNSSRALLRALLDDENYRNQLVLLAKELDEKSVAFLNTLLEK